MSSTHAGFGNAAVPRVVAELLLRAEEGSGSCLIVERDGGGGSLLDLVTAEALRRRFEVRTAVGSVATVGTHDALRTLLDGDSPGSTDLDAGRLDLERLRMLARRVDDVSVRAPLLIAVDHAELLDAASARFLSYLARNLDARPVSVLLIAAEVGHGSWLDELSLALDQRPHHLGADEAGPDRAAVRELLDSLDQGERDAVDALAVLGSSPSAAAVATVAAVEIEVAMRALDRLYELGLLRRTTSGVGQLVVAPIVLDTLTPTRRAELHGRAADHARAIGDAAERVAAHLEHAPPGSRPDAASILRSAADRALAAGDAPRAVTWLQRAIEEDGPDATVPLGVLLELSRAQQRAGDPGATASLQLAIERTTGDERRSLQLRLARHLALSSRMDEAVGVLEDVLAGLDVDDPAQARAVLEARVAMAATCRLSLELRDRSGALLDLLVPDPDAPLPDDPALLAELAYEHALAGTDRDIVIDLGRRALLAAAGGAPPPTSSQALFVALLSAEDIAGANLLLDRMHGDIRLHPLEAHRRGAIALAEGDLHRAVAWSRMAVADIEWVAPVYVPGARAQLARALIRQGDLDGATRALQLPGGKGRWRQTVTYHPVLLAQAELAAAGGDWWRAALFAEDCAAFSRRMGTHNPAVVPWPPVLVRALTHLDRAAEAEEVLAEAVARAEAFGAPTVLAALTELRADAGEPACAEASFEPPTARLPVAVDEGVVARGAGTPSLRLLGETALTIDGETRRLGDDLVDRAVCIVAIEPRGLHDEQLAEALWPESDPAVGRTRLRNVLARIRQRFGEIVVRSGRTVHLAPEIDVDLHAFDRLANDALAAQDDAVAEELGQQALAIHRGELCPSLPFESWAAAPRTATRQRWLALLDRLADLAARRGDITTSMALFEQAVAAEPWDEDRYLDAVERLIAADRVSAARALLRRSEAACEELGVPTSARHAALVARLG